MSSLQQLEAEHSHALAAADSIISALERQKRQPTTNEQSAIDGHIRTANALKPRIEAAKTKATPRTVAELHAQVGLPQRERVYVEPRTTHGEPLQPKRFSREYLAAVRAYMGGMGPLNASLNEGSNIAGGYAVPIEVEGNIIPLSPADSSIRRLATTIVTVRDLKIPRVDVHTTVAAKAETSAFGQATPTLSQFTLSAFMAGVEVITSLEALQDFDVLDLLIQDTLASFSDYESNLYINGTGNGQPQGLIGNVDAGGTFEPDSNSNPVTCAGIRSLIGSLRETYAVNGAFLMSKAASLSIRASQLQSGLFEPAFTRVGGQDYLYGYPVGYESSMPAAVRGNTPVLFGDFKRGYLIGDRGGSGINAKVLDQALATQGLVDLYFFRRTDGRVRRSEAIKSYTISAS